MKYSKRSGSSPLRRVLSLLLCMVLLLGLPPVFQEPAAAGNGGTENGNSEEILLLHIDTGIKPGTGVSYIAIHYLDASGVQRTEYLMMKDAQAKSKELFSRLLPGGDQVAQKQEVMKNWSGLQLTSKTTAEASLLSTNSSCDLLISLAFGFTSVVGIDIMMTPGEYWTCKSLSLYRVETLYGYDMVGYYGSDTFLNYDGELLCSVQVNGTYEYGDESYSVYAIRNTGREVGLTLVYNDGSKKATPAQLFLKLDVADEKGAGFQNLRQTAYSCCSLENMNLYEQLVVKLQYKTNPTTEDSKGSTKEVCIPVISSMVCYLGLECGTAVQQQIFGLGQQGTSLFCPFTLPDVDLTQEMTVTFYYGVTAAKSLCGSIMPTQTPQDESNLPSLTGIQIYQRDKDACVAGITDYVPAVDTTALGSPIMYYTSSTTGGFYVSTGKGTNIGSLIFTKSILSPSYKPLDKTTKFLVELKTDDVPNAGTKSELFMTLNYENLQGADCTYGPISLKTKTDEFYGDWPINPDDSPYYIGASQGETLRFFVMLENVSKFTGMTLYMRDEADDYQFTSIKIYDVKSVGERSIFYETVKTSQATTQWNISRSVTTGSVMVNFDRTTLVQKSSPKQIDFGAASSEAVTEIVTDWEQYVDYMSYQDAVKQNFTVSDSQITYTVKVKVHDDADATLETGDSGSENMFYFQLLFANGKTSGYVLANQQIMAGRFRSGKIETFTISMSFDYGELAAARIIPDDTVEEGKSFDKLYLEYVEVVKNNSASISPTWEFTINKWIDIDYRDSGAKSTATGLEGRTAGEITKSFPVTASTYSVNLLCEMDVFSADTNRPYSGALFALIKYKNVDGESVEETFDVGKLMFIYQGRESEMSTYIEDPSNYTIQVSQSTESEAQKFITRTKGVTLDQNTMLRENEYSRFLISLTEPKTITSVHFYTYTLGSSELKFHFSIEKILSGSGDIYLDKDGSYRRYYDTTELTSGTDDQGYSLMASASGQENGLEKVAVQKNSIILRDNEIDISEGDYSWASRLGREPASINDELNVYVHMTEPRDSIGLEVATPISNYNMEMDLSYRRKDSTGQLQTKETEQTIDMLKKDVDKNIFYIKGVDVSGLTTLKQLNLRAYLGSANDKDYELPNYKCLVDYVVVERVRSGVVIETLYSNFSGSGKANNEFGPLTAVLSSKSYPKDLNAKTSQTIMLQISEDSQPFTVTKLETGYSEQDIAVSIQYHTLNMFTDEDSINSKNVFISDLLNIGESKTVKPGDTLTLSLSQECLDGIHSITLSNTSSEMSVGIAGFCISLYDGKGDFTECYGNTNGSVVTLKTKTQTYPVLKNGMVPVTMEISTADMLSEKNTACRVPLQMTLMYEDSAGSRRTYTVADVKKSMTADSSMDSGGTAVLTLLLPMFQAMHTATFTLLDDNEKITESWRPEKIVLHTFAIGDTPAADRMVVINETVYEDTPYTVNLSNITLSATVTPGDDPAQITRGDNILSLLIESGETVRFTPSFQALTFVVGSFYDVDVNAYLVVDQATSYCDEYLEKEYNEPASADAEKTLGEFTFCPPINTKDEVVQYQVVITSQEVNTQKIVVNIMVQPAPEPETPPVEDEPVDPIENDEPTDQPNGDEPANQPDNDEPTDRPDGDEPANQPDDDEPADQPKEDEPMNHPDGDEPTNQSESDEPNEFSPNEESTEELEDEVEE